MTSLARSLAETEVLRSLQATEDLWLRTNRKLVDGEQDELPKPFFTRAEMDAVLERHAEEIAALKPADPTPGSWADWKKKQAEEKARAPAASSPYAAFGAALSKAYGQAPNVELSAAGTLDMVRAAIEDPRFRTAGMLREALKPALMLCPRPPIDATRQRHITSWLDTVAASWTAVLASRAAAGPSTPPDPLPPAPTSAADAAASAKLLKDAIEAGDIIELPSGTRIRHERNPT